MKNRISEIRKQQKLSQAELADRIGIHWVSLSKIERGITDPGTSRFHEIANALGTDFMSLWFEPVKVSDETQMPLLPPKPVPFAGITQAGVFRDVEQYAHDEERHVAQSPDPRYWRARQYVWQIAGDSMNEAGIHDGMFALGADYMDFERFYRPIQSGDIVVVQRERNDGHERELTIKKFWQEANGVALMPQSSNKAYKPIFIPRDGQVPGEEVRILAIVLSAFNLMGSPFIYSDD